MATVEIRGYVSRPESKVSKAGKGYCKYGVGVKQVDKAFGDKPEKVTWANFFVTDYGNSSPPTEKAYVTVTGYLKVNEVEKEGSKRTYLEVTAKTVEVAEPRDFVPGTKKQAEKDPWE